MIIPANINHRHLVSMSIGIASSCKINANIGSSALASNVEGEIEKIDDETLPQDVFKEAEFCSMCGP